MTAGWEPDSAACAGASAAIDISVAHPARMYDFLLGGRTNFKIDRAAVEHAAAAVGGIDNARADVHANRGFLGRVVRHLARHAGIRQFLDIGTGIPNGSDDTHTVAQQIAPQSRIVGVDNDPIVLAHSHELLRGSPEGAAAFIEGDLRHPDIILEKAAKTLDFAEPVALVLVAILHLIPDEGDPYGIVARLVDALPAGSYLAISHLSADFAPDAMTQLATRLNQRAKDTFVLRTRTQLERFFDGLDLVEPGVVQVDQWHPDHPRSEPAAAGTWVPSLYGAAGRKP